MPPGGLTRLPVHEGAARRRRSYDIILPRVTWDRSHSASQQVALLWQPHPHFWHQTAILQPARPLCVRNDLEAPKTWTEFLDVVRKLKAAQYTAKHPGQVCPAKWNDGAKTIAPSLDLVGKI